MNNSNQDMALVPTLDMAGAMVRDSLALTRNIEMRSNAYRDISFQMFRQAIGVDPVPTIITPDGQRIQSSNYGG